ncbi:hypothetical protein [Roseivivax sp. CAU 1761]
MNEAAALPDRFKTEGTPTDAKITITDNRTGRTTHVGLSHYGAVAKSLGDLFDGASAEAANALKAPEKSEPKAAKSGEQEVPEARQPTDDTGARKTQLISEAEALFSSEPAADAIPAVEEAPAVAAEKPTPKKRGRPRKAQTASQPEAPPAVEENNPAAPVEAVKQPEQAEAPKPRRGRPPKKVADEKPLAKEAKKAPAAKKPRTVKSKAAKPKKAAPNKAFKVIDGMGFQMVPRNDSKTEFYDIVATSGDHLGTVFRHEETGRYYVSPNDTGLLEASDHATLPAAKARIFVLAMKAK